MPFDVPVLDHDAVLRAVPPAAAIETVRDAFATVVAAVTSWHVDPRVARAAVVAGLPKAAVQDSP